MKELQTACTDTVTLLTSVDVHTDLQTAVMDELESVFDTGVKGKRFAVRSSAAGTIIIYRFKPGILFTYCFYLPVYNNRSWT